MSKTNKTRFEKMMAEILTCLVGSGCDDARNEFDALHLGRIQLDLIEEGQDGTEEDDPEAIKKWLKKWAK